MINLFIYKVLRCGGPFNHVMNYFAILNDKNRIKDH